MSEKFKTVHISSNESGVYTLTLNRPEVHNAFDETMIDELSEVISVLSEESALRTLVLRGNGRSFCAGADLNWMKRTSQYDEIQNYEDAFRMATMMNHLYGFPRPTIAVAHGNVYGGGVGLVACCDIVVAEENSVFSLSEVKLGLIPSAISPYVNQAIGPRNSRRYFLTGERFDAPTAQSIGLIHDYGDRARVAELESKLTRNLLDSAPNAQKTAKNLIQNVLTTPIDIQMSELTSKRIATVRASDEGKEGVAAFLEKRHPNWRRPTNH